MIKNCIPLNKALVMFCGKKRVRDKLWICMLMLKYRYEILIVSDT